jgi:hypothetical protein
MSTTTNKSTAQKVRKYAGEIPKGVPWFEDIPYKNGDNLDLDAKSYQDWVDEFMATLPWWKGKETTIGDKFVLFPKSFPTLYVQRYCSYVGFFGIPTPLKHPYEERARLKINRGGRTVGYVGFSDEVLIPVLAENNARRSVWMSLTPSEILSQRAGVKRGKGKVLIGGLGMGWLARRVLERKQVEHVTIYEKDPDVAKWFGEHLKHDFKGRVTIVVGDVWKTAFDKYDSILLDVWPASGDSKWDGRLDRLKAEGHNVWAWV